MELATIIWCVVLYVLYLGIRERIFSPNSYRIVDVCVAVTLLYRWFEYDELLSLMLFTAIGVTPLFLKDGRESPPAAQ